LGKKDRLIECPGNPLKRRDRLSIIAEILEIAKDGALKTPIMYKANLSFDQLNEYLSFLLEKKFLEVVIKSRGTTYKTTSKGLKYLQSYKEIKDLLKKKEENNVKNAKSPSDCRLTAKREEILDFEGTTRRHFEGLQYSACPAECERFKRIIGAL